MVLMIAQKIATMQVIIAQQKKKVANTYDTVIQILIKKGSNLELCHHRL